MARHEVVIYEWDECDAMCVAGRFPVHLWWMRWRRSLAHAASTSAPVAAGMHHMQHAIYEFLYYRMHFILSTIF